MAKIIHKIKTEKKKNLIPGLSEWVGMQNILNGHYRKFFFLESKFIAISVFTEMELVP